MADLRAKLGNFVGKLRRLPTHYKVLFLGQSAIMLFAMTVRVNDIRRAKTIAAAKEEAEEGGKEAEGGAKTTTAPAPATAPTAAAGGGRRPSEPERGGGGARSIRTAEAESIPLKADAQRSDLALARAPTARAPMARRPGSSDEATRRTTKIGIRGELAPRP